MRIYTYYEDINFEYQAPLLELWEHSWKKAGFKPRILTKKNATSNPDYLNFVNSLKKLHLELTNKNLTMYGLSCWNRWLAYAEEKSTEVFYVSDYDVINNSFKPGQPYENLSLLDSACPCIASGSSPQFAKLVESFIEITTQNLEKFKQEYARLNFRHFHDQQFFILCQLLNLGDFKFYRDREVFLSVPGHQDFWKKQLVHYAHAPCHNYCETLGVAFDGVARVNMIKKFSLRNKLWQEMDFMKKHHPWPHGSFEGDPLNPSAIPRSFIDKNQYLGYAKTNKKPFLNVVYQECIKPFINAETVALEVGPGRGGWTRCMLEAKEIYTLDVVEPPPKFLVDLNKIKYIVVNNFDCEELPDNHINYMFSFNTLCHITFAGMSEYAKNLFKKLKPGANCFWMIADEKKLSKSSGNEQRYPEEFKHTVGNFYRQGALETSEMLKDIGYEVVSEDLDILHRDPIIHFKKPL